MVVGDISTGTEVLVIGAGPGGYVAAIRAGQLDLDVTLVEKESYGGTCLNRGCIPSKALISGTGLADAAGAAEHMGIYAEPRIELSEMMEWKDGVVEQLAGGVEKLCKANGVNLIEGRAEFTDKTTARIVHSGEGQGAETIEFEFAIIATGSRPIEIPGFEFTEEPILDSAQALRLEEVPERLVVIGAGYVGMELSTVFAKLGSQVTVVEMLDSILPTYEEDLAGPVKQRAAGLGIDFQLGESAAGWTDSDDKGVIVRTEDTNGDTRTYPADKVLVAVGREAVTDTVNLDAAGIAPDENGVIETDDQARTRKQHIFAVGDVAGEPMLAHKGMMEGEVAAEVIAGRAAGLDYQAIPAAVFTDPEIGTVGLTAGEAEDSGFDPLVGEFAFQASGRALTTSHTDGFVRVVADADSGFVLGGQIVGEHASELISEVGLAVEMGATLEDLMLTVHTHPTLAEAVREAAAKALGQAIHTLNR